MTQVTDPNSKTTTIAYDSAERASTITRPDGSIQTFFPNQEQGWTNTGTSGSPAAATLLARRASIYTDPNGNVTNQFPDWNGQGLTDVYIDALGNVASYDRTSNGLATVTIDRLNRIDQYAYDTHGNITLLTNPDLTTEQYSYNSFAEVTKSTDENGHTYTYTYDSHGNLLVTEDPLRQPDDDDLHGRRHAGDAGGCEQAYDRLYQYDTQDRLTTVTNPDGTTDLYGYNSQGNVTSIDQRAGVHHHLQLRRDEPRNRDDRPAAQRRRPSCTTPVGICIVDAEAHPGRSDSADDYVFLRFDEPRGHGHGADVAR